MSEINLKNPKLRNYIRGALNTNKFGEPFATLLEEVFLREVYVLDLSPEELLEDINNFKNSIYYMSWGDCDGLENVMGVTYPGEHRIEFKTSYWQKIMNTYSPHTYCTKFFETFSHEVLHGMQNITDNRGFLYNRAGGWSNELGNRNHAIYEICTQGTAAKIANDRFLYQFDNNEILSGDGYSNEIFAVPLIASTFGVTEQEVLKYGMREREKLVKALDKNIGNIEKTRELIDKIEYQLEYLHSMHYPDENQKEFIKMTNDEKKKRGSQVIINLVDICQEALANRIINTPLDFDKNMAIKYKYDQKKIEDTLRHEIEIYGYNFKDDYMTLKSRFELSSNARYIKRAIEVFNEIGKDKTGKYLGLVPGLVAAVKRNDFDFCVRVGIIHDEALTFSLVNEAYDFKQKVMHDDYNDLRNWDNSRIFNAIYPGLKFSFTRFESSNLKNWKDIHTPEGMQKMQALKFVLNSQKDKYGVESKEYLLSFIDTDESKMDSFYRNFTRQNGAREVFKNNFRTLSDKEFLSRLIAELYINNSFYPDGSFKELATDTEKKVQSFLQPTFLKYGKEQLIFAIQKIIMNDEYDGISSEDSRLYLCMIGRKRLFNLFAQDMVNSLLNRRRIIPEKKIALSNAVFQTNKKYPNSMQERFVRLISEYKRTGKIMDRLFTSNGREEFKKYFGGDSKRNIEDLLGIFLDSYANLPYFNSPNILTKIIETNGKDYFRENMIKSILYDDYSGFTSQKEVEQIRLMSDENVLNIVTGTFIDESMRIGNVKEFQGNYIYNVNPAEIKDFAKKRRFGIFSKITDGLISNKDDKEINNQNEINIK